MLKGDDKSQILEVFYEHLHVVHFFGPPTAEQDTATLILPGYSPLLSSQRRPAKDPVGAWRTTEVSVDATLVDVVSLKVGS